jgi:pimeloyl-ACP methyl ester carboxylesterase
MVDDALPDARGASLAAAGHALMLDAPAALAKALRDFVPG